MTPRRAPILLAMAALALPAAAAAQGLGDAAAREKAKRAVAKKAVETRVFTNDDLHEGAAGTPAEAPAPPSSENAGARRRSDPDAEDRSANEASTREQEQQYLEALAAAQSRVSALESRIRELQDRLNPMSTSYIYGDFNVGGDKLAEENRTKAELAQAEADLTTARQAVVDATRAVDTFRQGRPTSPAPE